MGGGEKRGRTTLGADLQRLGWRDTRRRPTAEPARDHPFGGARLMRSANNPAGIGPGRFINALNVSGKLHESV